MGVSKVVLGDETLIDLTSDSVSSENLLQGATAHGADGEEVIGGVVVTPMYTGTKTDIEAAIAAGQIPDGAIVNITDDEETSSFQSQINQINDSLGGMFSYEERVIGKFLDGKTLYEKTVTFPTNTSNNRTTYNHGIENVDSIFINTGKSFTKYNDMFGVFPYVTYAGLGYSIGGSVNNTSIIIDKGNDVKTVPHIFYITLNYTKK